MACCAVAIFILSQAYVLLAAVRELIFGKSAPATAEVSGAAAWRFVESAASAPPRATRLRAASLLTLSPLTAAAGFTLGALSVAVLFVLSRAASVLPVAQAICGHLLP